MSEQIAQALKELGGSATTKQVASLVGLASGPAHAELARLMQAGRVTRQGLTYSLGATGGSGGEAAKIVEAPEQQTISTWDLADGRCPFRRYGDAYELDERCPQTLLCLMVPGAPVRTEDGRGRFAPIAEVPVATGYCLDECLNKLVREKERGLDVRERRATSGGGVLRGRRTQAPRRMSVKEQRERLAQQLLEERGR